MELLFPRWYNRLQIYSLPVIEKDREYIIDGMWKILEYLYPN